MVVAFYQIILPDLKALSPFMLTCLSMTLRDDFTKALADFASLIQSDRTVEAIERYYAEDAIVFENRDLARAGRDACALWEREQRRQLAKAPSVVVRAQGRDDGGTTAFFELVVRWEEQSGRCLRLEEVLIQRWHQGKIAEERYYYEGIIDESDDDSLPENLLS